MNYLSHGHEYCDRPYLLAGTAVPDWLGVSDRRVRVRPGTIAPWRESADEREALIAQGMLQHLEDDRWFHGTRAFLELCDEFTARIRLECSAEDCVRASFVAHVLIEILLDAAIAAEDRMPLARYYAAIAAIDAGAVEKAVARITSQRVTGLASFVRRFLSARFLEDYRDDALLTGRLNQVLERVGLAPLGPSFLPLVPRFRIRVAARAGALLPRRLPCTRDLGGHRE